MARISAFAIIENADGAVLLSHRRDKDLWNLPGGGVEKHENPLDAVIREVREETGLDVVVKKPLSIYFKAAQDELAFTFLCQITGGSPIETDEADQHDWFLELPANTSARQAERIEKYRTSPDEFTFGTHSS